MHRSKWLRENRNFQVNDLVIIKEDNIPPMRWKMGRIQEVSPGKDNLVRSVIVKTSTGFFERPIVKLGLLLENKE